MIGRWLKFILRAYCFPVISASVSVLIRCSKLFLGFRARELFYYLKGGQVDYGEEHSKACGHSQFGRIYEQGWLLINLDYPIPI